jgi:hypothetical protein
MAATRHGSQTTRNSSIPAVALDGLIAAGLGVGIGALDFAFFDASKKPELFHEFVFSKPHFLGLSYLGIHVTSYAIFAFTIFLASVFILFLFARIMRKLPLFYTPIFAL